MNFLKNKFKPKSDRRHNPINGHDAEVLAKAKFIIAMSGEVNSTSRELDSDKLDFIMNYNHPWKNEQLILFSQVKSGDSYGKEIANDNCIIVKSLFQELQKTTKNICLIWVNRETNNLFWAYIHTKTIIDHNRYGNHHKITPATRFDLARCFEKLNSVNFEYKGGKGITIRKLTKTFIENREFAKNEYKILKKSLIVNPLLGQINCSRLAWKHITRKNRRTEFKTTSFDTISYLYDILTKAPNNIAVLDCKYKTLKKNTLRTTEYILKYEDIILSFKEVTVPKKTRITVVVRVIENIIYPQEWYNDSQLSQKVKRSITLKSFYYKNN